MKERIKFIFIMSSKTARKKKYQKNLYKENKSLFLKTDRHDQSERNHKKNQRFEWAHKLTLLILIYIIYFKKFIMNLIRSEVSLMPFLWLLQECQYWSFPSSLYLPVSHLNNIVNKKNMFYAFLSLLSFTFFSF